MSKYDIDIKVQPLSNIESVIVQVMAVREFFFLFLFMNFGTPGPFRENTKDLSKYPLLKKDQLQFKM